jgi:hypothetical protein
MKENTRNSTINQSEREKKLARERKRDEKELKRMQDALQKKLGGSNNNMNQPKTPSALSTIPSTGTNSRGGWTNTEITTSRGGGGGGWSTSTIPITKPSIAKPSIIPAKSDPILTNQTTATQEPSTINTTSQPKKLSFGLKKNTRFKFGLIKK